jgi:hypothetical protein
MWITREIIASIASESLGLKVVAGGRAHTGVIGITFE